MLVNSSQIITSLQIFVLIFKRNTFYGYIKRRLEMPTKPNIIKKKFNFQQTQIDDLPLRN